MKQTLPVLLIASVASAAELATVNYTHNGDELQGFVATPKNASGLLPGLVIIPDWDGVNDYEKQRAEMVASDFGYVAMAADIYGKDLHFVENITERLELVNFYINDNPDIYVSRIQAAVETLHEAPNVDPDRVAIMGYCFGGTGVLTYALTYEGDNAAVAAVSFHGGLAGLPETGPDVIPKVLVLSGGEDDQSTDVMDLEVQLDGQNADWEITRYSGIEHAFTVFSDDRYNEWADMRSWASTKDFLQEAFGESFEQTGPPDAIAVEAVNYTDVDGTDLTGYISFPSDSNGPAPAVLILPDWDGNNEYEQERATILAEMGYVGFAADIYGSNLQTGLDMPTRIAQVGLYNNNQTLYVQRMTKALEVLKTYPEVDTDKIAVIGYCFGGTGSIHLAFSGNDEVKVVVPYHGGLQTLPDVITDISPYVLVQSGGDDAAHGNQTVLEMALNEGGGDWEITRYSGVVHGFTHWGVDAYSLKADDRSWTAMTQVLEGVFDLQVADNVDPATVPQTPTADDDVDTSSAPFSGMTVLSVCSLLLGWLLHW